MRRPSAPTGGAAPAVEHGEHDAALPCHLGELLLGAVDLPLRRQIATVLAGVRVAHHHLEPWARAAIEKLLDERPGATQVCDRLEQGNALERRPRLSCEALGGKDVVRGARHRDDQAIDRLGAMPRLCGCGRGQRATQPLVRFPDGRGMHPDVELRKMEPERAGTRAKVGQAAIRDPCSAMRAEKGVELVEVREQRSAVGVRIGAQRLPDRDERGAKRLVGLGELGHRTDHGRRHPPRRTQVRQLLAVELPGQSSCPLECVEDRVGADVRIAVEIAADPAAESKRAARASQSRGERPFDVGNGVPEGLLEEPQPLSDLIHHARPLGADLVRLPEERDLLREGGLDPLDLRWRCPLVVEPGEERGDAAMRLENGSPRRLRRVRGEDELDPQPRAGSLQRRLVDAPCVELRKGVGERLVRRSGPRPRTRASA